MVAIARCESNFRPDAKGPTQDGGVMQIHLPSHGARMKQLGLDVWDVEDNIAFARIIYDEQGIDAWVCHTQGLAYR